MFNLHIANKQKHLTKNGNTVCQTATINRSKSINRFTSPLAALVLICSNFAWATNNETPLEQSDLVVEYVANAGVKISIDEKVTLIDALFGPHKRFKSLNEQEFSELSKQGANLALATHAHSDHFHPKQTISFLKENKDALFVGTPQIQKHIVKTDKLNNVLIPTLKGYESHQLTHDGINVSVLNFPHMAPQEKTENYAYLVEYKGWKVLHVGDADINTDVINAHKLGSEDIDVLLIHDLFPVVKKDYKELLKQINAKHVAFVHIMDSRVKPFTNWVKTNLPNAKLIATGHEKRVFKK